MSDSKILNEYFVYIIRCEDNSYYVGMSEDLTRRMQEHKGSYGSGTTAIRKFEDLVYYETLSSKEEASQREKQIKGWSRQKKEALIQNNLTKLKLLSISTQSPKYQK